MDRCGILYTRHPIKSRDTSIYLLTRLTFEYYTSAKPIIIFCMVLMSNWNVSHHFEEEKKGGNINLFSNKPYLVAHHWEVLRIIKMMTLRRGFYTTSLAKKDFVEKASSTCWILVFFENRKYQFTFPPNLHVLSFARSLTFLSQSGYPSPNTHFSVVSLSGLLLRLK